MNIVQEDLDFVYLSETGQVEFIRKDAFEFDPQWGLIKVLGAHLTHFSRFGWIRYHASGI
jgi:hypothetical protein